MRGLIRHEVSSNLDGIQNTNLHFEHLEEFLRFLGEFKEIGQLRAASAKDTGYVWKPGW